VPISQVICAYLAPMERAKVLNISYLYIVLRRYFAVFYKKVI